MSYKDYWDGYYGVKRDFSAPEVPSQFAAFLLSEIKGRDTKIIDFGCGNGRDTLFFARHGFEALGVDASKVAIQNCINRNVPYANFICKSISSPDLLESISEKLGGFEKEEVTIYSRFFLHAIDEGAQTEFLKLCRKILQRKGMAAFEFRTNRDEMQAKVTPSHYRRFINPLEFMAEAADYGFKISYFVEGFGYAKYKSDDAHVARIILEVSK